VVVGFDGTEYSRRAALTAAGLAGHEGRVIVVPVIEPSQAVGARIEGIGPRERERARALAAEAREALSAIDVRVEIEPRIGDPATELALAGEQHAADMIALGRGEHRHVEVRRRVWDQVVRRSGVPVIVVP
jgi:nucleotide-binding universal stress UspA family protein